MFDPGPERDSASPHAFVLQTQVKSSLFKQVKAAPEKFDELFKLIGNEQEHKKVVSVTDLKLPEEFKLFENIIDENGYCTMKNTTNFCKLEPYRYGKYKWPKLCELYKILYNKSIIQSHIAIEDVDILYKCFKKFNSLFT